MKRIGVFKAAVFSPLMLGLDGIAAGQTPPIAPQSDLISAFSATFGSPPPMTRALAPGDKGPSSKLWPTGIREVSLKPDRLVPLGGSRWALLVRETAHGVDGFPGYSTPGALTVAYLVHGNTWSLERLWTEIGEGGVGGEIGNDGTEIHQFGGPPLYFMTNEWCGMGSCSEDVLVVQLDASGPRLLGDLEGGAAYPARPDMTPIEPYCESYKVSVRIISPRKNPAMFRVVYEGWTAPPGRLLPKHSFSVSADVVEIGNRLQMSPKLKVPDCAR